jgi:uncharacterized membrane protein (UPF0127 family)
LQPQPSPVTLLSSRNLAVLLIAFVLIIAAVYTIEYYQSIQSVSGSVPSRFTVGGKTFNFTYVATTESERQRGLMNRSITASTTMLFVFPSSGYYSFWMFDTNTSLDMIWVNANGNAGTVVYIVKGAASCYVQTRCPNYTPNQAANFVIEAKAGFADTYGIGVGSAITLSS